MVPGETCLVHDVVSGDDTKFSLFEEFYMHGAVHVCRLAVLDDVGLSMMACRHLETRTLSSSTSSRIAANDVHDEG